MACGIDKKFGLVPAKPYIAIDSKYDDRAWVLIDGCWVFKQGIAFHVVRFQ